MSGEHHEGCGCEGACRCGTARTRDVLTVAAFGEKRKMTPEGFMLCESFPIARIGEYLYAPGEVPIAAGPEGYVSIVRDGSELFARDTVESIIGKPVTDDHPTVDVVPGNWRQLACGTVLDAWRGDGDMADFLLADVLITCPKLIEDVNAGKREVSPGYDCQYVEDGPGLGRQRNILFNHLAVVDAGRCGYRCSIGDRAAPDLPPKPLATELLTMLKNPIQAIRDAFATGKPDLVQAALDAAEKAGGGEAGQTRDSTNVHIHMGKTRDADKDDEDKDEGKAKTGDADFEERMKKCEDGIASIAKTVDGIAKALDKKSKDADPDKDDDDATTDEAILGQFKMEAPPGTNDAAIAKARDSAFLEDAFQEAVSDAEVLAPGIRIPTFDRASKPKRTFDTICTLRKTALDMAYGRAELREELVRLNGGRPLEAAKLTCDGARVMVRAAATIAKAFNTRDTGAGSRLPQAQQQKSGPRSIADLNEANRKFYERA